MLFGCCVPSKDYQLAEQAGFDFVEFSGAEIFNMSDAEFERVCKSVRTGKLPCVSFNSYCGGSPAIVGGEFDVELVSSYAESLCRRAAALGVRMLGIGAPNARRLPPGFQNKRADAQCKTFLRMTAGVAKAYGMRVNFEQLNPRACEYGTSTKKVAALVREVGASNLALVVDFYHRAVAGEPVGDFAGFQDLICHTHISTCGANLERGYPDMKDFAYYVELFSDLKKAGYHGTMSIEAPAENLSRQGEAALKMLRLADLESGGWA